MAARLVHLGLAAQSLSDRLFCGILILMAVLLAARKLSDI
jgi:hypothetical protein